MARTKLLWILLLAGISLSAYAERKVQFVLQTGTSYRLLGFYEEEIGDENDPDVYEEELMPGMYMNQLQIGIGQNINDSLYLGFMVGGWVNTDFSSYAITNASLYSKYAFTEQDLSPIATFQGGLYMEGFPDSFLGFVINPALGVEWNRLSGVPLHLTAGYLLTFYNFEGTAPDDDTYLNNESKQEHGISLTLGFSF